VPSSDKLVVELSPLRPGTIGSLDIGSGAIVSGRIASGQVGFGHLANASVQSGTIASGQVGFGHLANASVASGTLASGVVSQFHHASGAVNSGHIGSGAVLGQAGGGAFTIASGTIGSLDIGSGAIVSGRIASGQVGAGHLASGQISTYKIASGTATTRSQFAAPFVSGSAWTVLAEENISGGRAVAMSPSGNLLVAMASVPSRMPAIGVVFDNVASGIAADVYTAGVVQFTSGLADYSGYVGNSLYVGRSGQIVTASGSFNSGGFLSGDILQPLGVPNNSGGALIGLGKSIY
jgi:hypothetical protein